MRYSFSTKEFTVLSADPGKTGEYKDDASDGSSPGGTPNRGGGLNGRYVKRSGASCGT